MPLSNQNFKALANFFYRNPKDSSAPASTGDVQEAQGSFDPMYDTGYNDQHQNISRSSSFTGFDDQPGTLNRYHSTSQHSMHNAFNNNAPFSQPPEFSDEYSFNRYSNSSFHRQNSRVSYYPSYDTETIHRHNSYNEFPESHNSECFDQGPPPVPPPHSVSMNSLKRDDSKDSFTSLSNRKGIISDRTPSPLRHAMDDVLSSLDNMQLKDPNSLGNSPVKDEPRTPSHTGDWDKQSSDILQSVSPSIPTHQSIFGSPNKVSNNQPKHTPNSHEDEAPFDSNSYNSPASATPSRQSSYNVNISRTTSSNSMNPDPIVSRTDTYKSLSSVNTNTLSIFSKSTTPTDISNSSTSSAESSASMRGETYFKMEGVPGLSNSIAYSIEKPVTLPTARQHRSPTQSPKRTIKTQKSGGFLKKFFSAASGYTPPSQVGSKRRLGPQFPSDQSHGRASSSLSIRDTIRKVSGKSYAGRTALSSADLYPSRSGTGDTLPETDRWIEIHRNVHRTNTLTQKERDQRKIRPQVDGIRALEPIDNILRIAGNETQDGGYTMNDQRVLNLSSHNFLVVDNNITNLHSWPFVTPGELARGHIIQKFSDQLDQLRAVFDFCALKLKWEMLVADDMQEEVIGSLARVMQTRRASSFDVAHSFKQMCDALSIRCDVISGYLKGPGEVWHNPGIPRSNHYWNAVVIEGLWRMVDASLASPSFPTRDIYSKCDKRTPEYFYFLARPCELLFTHVPYNLVDEHIVPSLSHEVSIALPLAGPLAFKYNLELIDFSTSLTRMQDLDVTELTVHVPMEIELFAEVVAGTFPAGSAQLLLDTEDHKKSPALSQVFWQNDKRYYRIKAVLPPSHSQGALNLYVGPRGTLKSITNNVLSLAYSMPMIHQGENPALHFVIRHPTPQSSSQDIYINEPQCRDLVHGQSYVFSMRQHPSTGNTRSARKIKMALQTPGGKIIKLNKTDGMTKQFGVWEGNVKCLDAGTWRGLILSDTGNAWSVYAEWHCS